MKLLKHFTANDEKLTPYPFKRELSMEAYLIDNMNVLALDDNTFSSVDIIQEEVPLKDGGQVKGRNGRLDLLVKYQPNYIGIVELKLGTLTNEHLKQLGHYLKVREKILERDEFKNLIDPEVGENPKWVGVLVGDSIDDALAKKIKDGHTIDDVSIAALTINRFKGKNDSIYVLTNTYFKDNSSTRDKTKYEFLGKTYGKSRLVLAVVKEHVSRHTDITYAALEKSFPTTAQGSQGVFETLEKANEIIERQSAASGARHFVKADEIIEIQDSTIAVCNQWGIGNIHKFLEQVSKLGYDIKQV